jgi:hypothetical protein
MTFRDVDRRGVDRQGKKHDEEDEVLYDERRLM